MCIFQVHLVRYQTDEMCILFLDRCYSQGLVVVIMRWEAGHP